MTNVRIITLCVALLAGLAQAQTPEFAAIAAATSPKNQCSKVMPFYYEVGVASGETVVGVSGSGGPYNQKTSLLIAPGVTTSPHAYAVGLRLLLTTQKVCDPNCRIGTLTQEIDGSFSSVGATGFYAWISKDQKSYGTVARNVAGGGPASQACGQAIRKAYQEAAKRLLPLPKKSSDALSRESKR